MENLLHKHPSKPFNPDIATAFFRAGLIEAWGRGTLKIISECAKVKLPQPIFHYDLSGFVTEFIENNLAGETKKMAGQVGQMAGENKGLAGETGRLAGENNNLAEEIGEIEKKIKNLLKGDGRLTIPELANIIGVAKRTTERYIKKLQELNQIERVGGTKGGKWEVAEETKKLAGENKGLAGEIEKLAGESNVVAEETGEIEKKIKNLLKGDGTISIPELANRIGIAKRTIERYIKKLQELNQLERIGGTKSGKWKIKDSI